MAQSSAAVKARYREKHREKLRAKGREYQARRRAEDPEYAERGRERIRRLACEQPEYLAAIQKRSYEKHAEKRRAARLAYREMNLAREAAYARAWYQANRVSERPYQPREPRTPEERVARKAEMDKAWRENNRERYRVNKADAAARRRTLVKGGAVARVDRQQIFDRDNGVCHICQRPCAREDFHLDHLVPISRGGDHVPENVAVSHPACNLRRGAGRLPAQLRLVS